MQERKTWRTLEKYEEAMAKHDEEWRQKILSNPNTTQEEKEKNLRLVELFRSLVIPNDVD